MGRGGYRGASTIVNPWSRKWQSEDFYAYPLDPEWKRKVLKMREATTKDEAGNSQPKPHIHQWEVLWRAIMARNPKLLEVTTELVEARRHCPQNVGILKVWLTQPPSPFEPLPEGQFIKFSWKRAKALARQLGLRPSWPPKRKGLSEGDIELLKRVAKSAIPVLRETFPQKKLIRVVYYDED